MDCLSEQFGSCVTFSAIGGCDYPTSAAAIQKSQEKW